MSVTHLAHAVVTFYEGARAHAVGALLSNENTADAGLKMIKAALAMIDTSEIGRDILIPFLSHADPMVRFEAARSLHAIRRDLATPVLHDLSLGGVTEASACADIFLITSGEPNKDSSTFAIHYPHKYDDTLYRRALERFYNEAHISR